MDSPESNDNAFKSDRCFNTTHWSVVLQAGQQHSSQSRDALEKLCRAYWHPIYAFARRKGRGEEEAKDLTQQFFSRLLERNDFSGLDPRKGKFRTFLLTAFTHFLANERDYANAAKRGGGGIIISLDGLTDEQLSRSDLAQDCPPAKLFDLRWARSIVEQALERLRSEMSTAGKTANFDLLKSFLAAEAHEGEYASVARQMGVADASVAVLVHRMRQRYRQLVREQVAQTVTSPAELDEEMRHLFEVLNQ